MSKILKSIFVLAIAGMLVFAFKNPLENALKRIESAYLPCQQPITYDIGSFDERFGISRTDFLNAINEAAQIWESPIGRQLFEYKAGGDLKINLIYDYRQEATVKLRQMGLIVSDTKASYDELKARYDALQSQIIRDKESLKIQEDAFQTRKDAYDKEVQYWNKRGGAPKNIYDQLAAEKAALDSELAQIQQLGDKINSEIDQINSLAVILNRLVATLNLNVANFNEINQERGGEFQEGVYISGPGGQEIDIYQFDDTNKLVRVLAHELGHALGLEHLDNPKAIMYRLNEAGNEKLTADDLAELKNRCGIK